MRFQPVTYAMNRVAFAKRLNEEEMLDRSGKARQAAAAHSAAPAPVEGT